MSARSLRNGCYASCMLPYLRVVLGPLVACVVPLFLVIASGCATGGEPSVSGSDAAADGATLADATLPSPDAMPPPDATMASDASPMDDASADARPPDASTPDASIPDASSPDASGPPCDVGPSFVIITEVMIASVSGSRDRGEWFEVHNPGDCEANLSGLTVSSPTSTGTLRTHTIAGLRIPAGGFVTLGQSLNPTEHHGAGIDYAYGTGSRSTEIVFSNGSDSLRLAAGDTTIDEVSWGSSGFSYSKSRQFPSGGSPLDRATWSEWCDSTMVFSMEGGTFYGTPGSANDARCP